MNDEIQNLRELIDRISQRQPGAAFLISPETGIILTFQQLQKGSAAFATQLARAGLQPGDKVALLMDNGILTVQLFLGAMYGGFVAVPLNVRAGTTQLSYMLDHCDAKVVFVGEAYRNMIQEVAVGIQRALRVECLNANGVPWTCEADSLMAPLPTPAAGDVALLMYTSGSTSLPKAAIHSHRTVLAGGRNSVLSHQLTSADRSLLVLPLYHINAECVTLIPTLLSGGSVVVPSRFSVSHFWDWLDEYRCTWAALVPTIISQLLDWKDPQADSRQAAFSRIRFFRSSSAPLAPSLHREFLDRFKLLLIQAMGSTEAGNMFSNPLPPGENKIGSPGLPWGFEAKILDRDGNQVPTGESGEVFIRGPAVMQGYYKDPAGTAAVLSADGWMRTGDLAYRDDDGYFFIIGRSKELIIKGGVNIAPRQIDDVLESHPSVLEAAALGVPDKYLGEDLVAFVTTRTEMELSETELLSFCEARLGFFKTPTRIYFVKELPKGPSGKVQRLKLLEQASQSGAALPDSHPTPALLAEGNGHAVRPAPAMPAMPIEEIISQIWTDLLAQPQIDVHANFFELGGHSLLATQCISRVREKLPITLSLSDFFENATIAQQAALIRRRLDRDGSVLAEPGAAKNDGIETIPPRNPSLPCPLSPGQQRLWFLEQLHPGLPVYNEAEAVLLRGELDADAIERALNIIVARHEMLRTTIEVSDGQPVAVVRDSRPLQLKRIDLAAFPPAQRQAEVDRLLIHEPRRLYHLETEPGIRATLVRLDNHEHALILMMHHIICDWSSEGVIWRELSALYRAISRGQAPELPTLPIQHGDYAVWQQQRVANGAFAADLAFWEENLRGAPSLLELPTDRPRPRVASFRGARQRFQIDRRVVGAARECSRRERVTLFTVFAAALDVLLYRYTAQQDISLGIALSDRDRPELQSLIGFLLHTHVLRTRLSGDMTVRELLDRVKNGVLALHEHRAVPFEQVVSRVQADRTLSHSPLFQVLINWRDREQQLSFIGMEGLEVESLLAETRTSKFDLTMMLTDGGEDIWLEVEYSTDLFDDDRIVRMAGHYQTILESAAAVPQQRLAELPLLTEPERRQMLVDWNRTAADYPRDRLVHQLFEKQVEKSPDALAVVFEGDHLTYRELNERANCVAQHLRGLGVGPDLLVGICMERSLEMIVSLLGILKAGGAYLPLDPKLPAARLSFVVEDSRPRVILTSELMQPHLPACQTELVSVDSLLRNKADRNGSASVGVEPQASDLAYVLYTSGSTGTPKGVQIPHRAFVNFLGSMTQSPGLDAKDTLLAVTTLSFDIAGLELFLPLVTGARVVIASSEAASDATQLMSLMERCGASVMQATPATWRMLLDAGWRGNPQLKILCGGEAWSTDLANELLPRSASLWNMYGPTETTIWSSVTKVEGGKPVSIGPPIANTTFYILDGNRQPAPIGVRGELHIGGDGLARGYVNRPELTAEKFIPDPFTNDPAARLYRTGDSARYLSDGNLEFLGRLDNQVKIRGFRIEPGEVESVLAGHPAVRDAVVLAREDVPGDKRLVAYLTFKDGQRSTPLELRQLLQDKVPDYMVPSAFVTLDRFPLTPNGKADRKAFPAPNVADRASMDLQTAAATPTEKALTSIWCDILGVKQVGIHDNFFELGGHSLLTVRLQARIEKELGRRLPVAVLFQAPTVAQCAELLAESTDSDQPSNVATFISQGEGTPLFLFGDLVPAQRLVKHLEPKRAVYGIYSPFQSELNLFRKTGQVTISMEELAERCIKEIRRVRPRGPYHLAGFCFGGVLALEIAEQLRRQDQRVALVGLLNTYRRAEPNPTLMPRKLRRLVHHFRQVMVQGPRYIPIKVHEFFSVRVLQPLMYYSILFTREIQKRYAIRPYNGAVLCLRSTTNPPQPGYNVSVKGWGDLMLGSFHVEDIRCSFPDFNKDPHIGDVARKLDQYMSSLDTVEPQLEVCLTRDSEGPAIGELQRPGGANFSAAIASK